MKVYIVLFDYGNYCEGCGEPEGVFLNRENAEAFRDELNGPDHDEAVVIEMTVADYEESNGYA